MTRFNNFESITVRVRPFVTVAVLTALLLTSKADQVTVAPNFGPWQTGSGGEFTMTPDLGLKAKLGAYSPFTMNQGGFLGSFQTFCMERNEYIIPNMLYDVTITNITIFSGDKLSAGVAYLYEKFALGQLNYNYADSPVGGRTTVGFADALLLQNAMWYLMGNQYSGQAGNPFVLAADAALGGSANSFLPDNGAHHVSILNLWAPGQPHDPQHAFQDVLIYTGVPEPSVFALISVAGLLAFRRRK